MSFGPRPAGLPSHLRSSSGLGFSAPNNPQSSALASRVAEKKAELDSLRQLRDLSASLVGQMQQLEDKLSTLTDGTQAVAEVMSNWGTVLRAIALASTKIPNPKSDSNAEPDLPQTLVRIPINQAEEAQKRAEDDPTAIG